MVSETPTMQDNNQKSSQSGLHKTFSPGVDFSPLVQKYMDQARKTLFSPATQSIPIELEGDEAEGSVGLELHIEFPAITSPLASPVVTENFAVFSTTAETASNQVVAKDSTQAEGFSACDDVSQALQSSMQVAKKMIRFLLFKKGHTVSGLLQQKSIICLPRLEKKLSWRVHGC